MNTALSPENARAGTGWTPLGGFLDQLPQAMYALAHVMFLAVGVWLVLRASDSSLARPEALALYVASQVGFLGYFARVITMKLAVLVEQTLIFTMLLLIVL